jgi:transcriptional antiterminator RfaH
MENQLKIRSLNTKNWFVIYTRARWEKKVDQLLKQQGINSYCPMRTVENQWADRKKIVELPLFSSYLFVNINLKEELTVRQTHGVLNFIYFLGKPAIVQDSEIEKIKNVLKENPDTEVVSLKGVRVGDRVRIKNGILANHNGNIVKVNGKTVLMVFDHLDCALVSRVSVSDLTPILR